MTCDRQIIAAPAGYWLVTLYSPNGNQAPFKVKERLVIGWSIDANEDYPRPVIFDDNKTDAWDTWDSVLELPDGRCIRIDDNSEIYANRTAWLTVYRGRISPEEVEDQ